jgi:hypothetical protein
LDGSPPKLKVVGRKASSGARSRGTSALSVSAEASESTGALATHVLIAVQDRDAERQEAMTAINAVRKDVAKLVRQVRKLERDAADANPPLATFITTLAPFGLKVNVPIPVTIQQDGDEFVASYLEANVSTGGTTAPRAIANLQSLIADFYFDTKDVPDNELGRSMLAQKRILQEVLCPIS